MFEFSTFRKRAARTIPRSLKLGCPDGLKGILLPAEGRDWWGKVVRHGVMSKINAKTLDIYLRTTGWGKWVRTL